MTHADLAQKIREAVYARASEEGGAISKEQMEDTIGRVLAVALPVAPQPAWAYTSWAPPDTDLAATLLCCAPHMARYEEWR